MKPDFYQELIKDWQVFEAVKGLGLTPGVLELINTRIESLRQCFALPDVKEGEKHGNHHNSCTRNHVSLLRK